VLGIGLESLLVEVPGSETGVVTPFGQYTQRTLGPGLNVKLPWEGVVVVNTSVQALKQEKSDAFTSDKQHAYTDYTVNFAIRPAAAPDVLRNYQGDIEERIIEPRVEFWLKDIEPKYSATDLINNRVGVAQAAQKHLEDDLRDRGVDVVGVYITNISFGDAYQHASEALAAAQQDLQHERIELQIRQVKAQQVIADAQGQASANKLIRDSLPRTRRRPTLSCACASSTCSKRSGTARCRSRSAAGPFYRLVIRGHPENRRCAFSVGTLVPVCWHSFLLQ